MLVLAPLGEGLIDEPNVVPDFLANMLSDTSIIRDFRPKTVSLLEQ